MKKFDAYKDCLTVLLKSSRDNARTDEIYRMGVIWQFNLTFELSWKAIKEVLSVYGVNEAKSGSPHSIIKAGYAAGFLTDADVWLDMLEKRNRAVHVYDEKQSAELTDLIFERYMAAFIDLQKILAANIVAAQRDNF